MPGARTCSSVPGSRTARCRSPATARPAGLRPAGLRPAGVRRRSVLPVRYYPVCRALLSPGRRPALMTANSLTTDYLADAQRSGTPPTQLAEVAARTVDLAATTYQGRCLTRPVFLEHGEFARLCQDVEQLHATLTGLPGRLFGGDLAAFARAVGTTPEQTSAILRGSSGTPTRLCRADLYREPARFALMEVNMGGTVGGLDNALLNTAFLSQPLVADFVAAHGLAYVDTMAALADTIPAACGIPHRD